MSILKPGITTEEVNQILADLTNQTMTKTLEAAAKVAEREMERLGCGHHGPSVAEKIRALKKVKVS